MTPKVLCLDHFYRNYSFFKETDRKKVSEFSYDSLVSSRVQKEKIAQIIWNLPQKALNLFLSNETKNVFLADETEMLCAKNHHVFYWTPYKYFDKLNVNQIHILPDTHLHLRWTHVGFRYNGQPSKSFALPSNPVYQNWNTLIPYWRLTQYLDRNTKKQYLAFRKTSSISQSAVIRQNSSEALIDSLRDVRVYHQFGLSKIP